MKTISKKIIGVALSALLLVTTSFTDYRVTYPEAITIEDIEEQIPIETTTQESRSAAPTI